MKNIKRFFFIGIIAFLRIGSVNAQVDLAGALRAGPEDASRYLENYMEPAILSFANGLANGWVNTAKAHKSLGFDLTFSVNLARIPEEALTFAYGATSDWSNLRIVGGGNPNLPTLVGGRTNTQLELRTDAMISDPISGQSITYTVASAPFAAAPGIEASKTFFSGIPVQTLQLGIGLVKNTDLKIRYFPEISTDDFKISMFGIGIMHDIKQWIPGMKLVPMSIAIFAGTTSMRAKILTQIDQPYIDDGNTVLDDTDVFYTVGNAETELKISSTTIQILASKKLLFFTPFISVGYNIVRSSLDVKGTYRYADNLGGSIDLVNPINLEFGGRSFPRATIGARLKLLILTLHASYSFQEYSTFTAGVGISVR